MGSNCRDRERESYSNKGFISNKVKVKIKTKKEEVSKKYSGTDGGKSHF